MIINTLYNHKKYHSINTKKQTVSNSINHKTIFTFTFLNSSKTFRFFLSTILFCPMFRDCILCSGCSFKILNAASTACWLNLFCAKFNLSTDNKHLKPFSTNESSSLLRISFTVFTLYELWTASKIIISSSGFGYAPVKSTVSILLPEMLSINDWYLKRYLFFLTFVVYGFWSLFTLFNDDFEPLPVNVLDLDDIWEMFDLLESS